MMESFFIHGTCVAIDGKGILLRGVSGAGKSDLAFRLIQGPLRAHLVADDQVGLTDKAGQVFAFAPAALIGLLELRGLGLMVMPTVAHVQLVMVIDLVPRYAVSRFPSARSVWLCGIELPLLALHSFDLTTTDKVGLALNLICEDRILGDSRHISSLL
jgi:hypothetical protein